MIPTVLQENHGYAVDDLVEQAPRMYAKQTCCETLRVFQGYPEAPCVIVCDKREQPVGLVMRDSFFLKLNGPGGMDTWQRESIVKMMNKTPITADIESPLELLIAAFSARPAGNRINYVIAMKKSSIIGVINAAHLLSRS